MLADPGKRVVAVCGDEEYVVADVRVEGEQRRGNPELIAAAPDLLTACKLALNAFEKRWAIDWSELEKAIKKAEGQEPDPNWARGLIRY